MERKAFDNLTPDELFEKIKDSVIELFDLRWDKGISHELSHDEFFDVVCDETEALDLNVDEDTLYDTATKARQIVNAFLQKKSQDLSNPSDKRCKGKYLASVINDLSGSDDELAIALGYYATNDKDEKVALVDEFLKAKEDCIKEGVNGISRFSEEYFDVYKERLVMMGAKGKSPTLARTVRSLVNFKGGHEMFMFDPKEEESLQKIRDRHYEKSSKNIS